MRRWSMKIALVKLSFENQMNVLLFSFVDDDASNSDVKIDLVFLLSEYSTTKSNLLQETFVIFILLGLILLITAQIKAAPILLHSSTETLQ